MSGILPLLVVHVIDESEHVPIPPLTTIGVELVSHTIIDVIIAHKPVKYHLMY